MESWLFVVLLLTTQGQVSKDNDLFLVSTMDGIVHAIDSRGTIRWALRTGNSFLKTYYSNDVFEKDTEVVLPTTEGQLVSLTKGVFRMGETGVKELVEECPRLKDGLYLVGEKRVRAYSVDAQTGRLLAVYSDSKGAAVALEKVRPQHDTLVIGLVEYIVQALDVDTFEPKWNLTYTEIVPTSKKDGAAVSEPLQSQIDILMQTLKLKNQVVVSVNGVSEDSGNVFPVEMKPRSGKSFVKVNQIGKGIYAEIVDEPMEGIDRTGLAPLELPSVYQKALPMYGVAEETDGRRYVLDCVLSLLVITLLVLYSRSRVKRTPTQLTVSRSLDTHQTITPLKPISTDPPNQKRIGKLTLFLDKPLGDGSHGTIVFEGLFMEREVAVKRMLSNLYFSAKQEINLLLKADSHPNVVTFYAWEEDTDFIYLAIEKCCGTLGDIVEALALTNKRKRKLALSRFPVISETLSLLHDAAEGLAYLHSLNIVHRDIKPMNILIDSNGRAKIADMASAKALREDQSSYGTQAHGSAGWQPAEVLLNKRRNRSVDIFSLGCAMYYCLVPGIHPFGERLVRDQNIIEGKCVLDGLTPEATHLIKMMISPVPEARPTSTYTCAHPLFWPVSKKLELIIDFSDRLEAEGNGSVIELKFEQSMQGMLTAPWNDTLAPAFFFSLEKYRKYNFLSVKDLLRVIRNKRHHYHELSEEAKAVVGDIPVGYYTYFAGLFPELFIRIFKFVEENLGSDQLYLRYM